MWFSFPKGVTNITVERQEFKAEHEADGVSYFRAPAHFAPKILSLGIKGFGTVSQPEGAPDDLPAVTGNDDERTLDLGRQIERLEDQLASARADAQALGAETKALQGKLKASKVEIEELKAKLEAKDDDE